VPLSVLVPFPSEKLAKLQSAAAYSREPIWTCHWSLGVQCRPSSQSQSLLIGSLVVTCLQINRLELEGFHSPECNIPIIAGWFVTPRGQFRIIMGVRLMWGIENNGDVFGVCIRGYLESGILWSSPDFCRQIRLATVVFSTYCGVVTVSHFEPGRSRFEILMAALSGACWALRAAFEFPQHDDTLDFFDRTAGISEDVLWVLQRCPCPFNVGSLVHMFLLIIHLSNNLWLFSYC
jgi:hypothetical protein